jgi:hypothetical protein
MVTAHLSRKPATAEWQETLRRWLQWNEAYEQLTLRMFQAKDDPARLEALAEQLEHARQAIVAASRDLLQAAV